MNNVQVFVLQYNKYVPGWYVHSAVKPGSQIMMLAPALQCKHHSDTGMEPILTPASKA